MALDCKPLLLPPPPLALFFLIASWAISGPLFKWEVGGSEYSKARVEGSICASVCVWEGVLGPAEALNKHSDSKQDQW